MAECCGWAWKATREVFLDEEQIDRNLLEERQSGQTRTVCTPFRAGVPHSAHHDRLSFQHFGFYMADQTAIGSPVNSDNLRIIGSLFFLYKEWPLGECRLSLLGIDGILLYVSHRSVLQPAGLS